MKEKLIIVTLVTMFCFACLATIPWAKETQQLQGVTVRMNWFPVEVYAPYQLAQDKGFYAEEGLDVKLMPGKGSAVSTKLVAAKEDDFGIASGSTVLIARTKDMPIKVVAITHQNTPACVVYRKDSGIKSPKDLEGKTVAVDLNSTKYQQFVAFCKKNGVDITKIKIISISGGTQDLQLLLKGKVDLSLHFNYQIDSELRRQGVRDNFDMMMFSDYGIRFHDLSIITHDDTIKNKPDLVKKFVKASIKGWKYAIDHPEEAIDILVKYYPELDRDSVLESFKGVIHLVENQDTKKYGFGYQTKEQWKEMQDILFDLKIIDKKIDVSTVYTNEFLQ